MNNLNYKEASELFNKFCKENKSNGNCCSSKCNIFKSFFMNPKFDEDEIDSLSCSDLFANYPNEMENILIKFKN